MHTITGTVRNGQIILDQPPNLPEGCRVVIAPLTQETSAIREEDWQDTPEAVAAWLQWYDELEPLQRTPQEEAEWESVRQAQKARETAW